MRRILLLTILLQTTCLVARAQDQLSDPLPKWVREEWDFLTRGSGIWIADNSEFKADNNPYDAFGIKWEYGIGKTSIKGRLYGIVDGKEVETFWEFRSIWHPVEKAVIAMQFGGNATYGVGKSRSTGEGMVEMDQQFYNSRGKGMHVGHRSESRGDTHISQSFQIAEDGTWVPMRSYTWVLQK